MFCQSHCLLLSLEPPRVILKASVSPLLQGGGRPCHRDVRAWGGDRGCYKQLVTAPRIWTKEIPLGKNAVVLATWDIVCIRKRRDKSEMTVRTPLSFLQSGLAL